MENKRIVPVKNVRAKDYLLTLTSKREIVLKDGKKFIVTDTLDFGAFKGNPRFTLKRGSVPDGHENFVPDSRENFLKSITIIAFKPLAFSIFINKVKEDAIAEKEEFTTTYLGYNNKFVNNVRTEELYVQGKIEFSRDDKGIYFITVKEESKEDTVFKLEFTEYFDIEQKKIKIKSKRIQSMSAFKSYINLITESAASFRLNFIAGK